MWVLRARDERSPDWLSYLPSLAPGQANDFLPSPCLGGQLGQLL